MKKNPISLSVVIPTLNPGGDLSVFLSRLRLQTDFSDAEILVVDSSSTDGTPELARQYGARVLSIAREDFNHGDTRNLGVEASRGEWVCLFTQDALPVDNNYLKTLVDSVEREGAAGGFARQIPRPNASPLARRDVESWIAGSSQRRAMKIASMNAFLASPPIERYLACVFDNVASIIRRDVWEIIPFPRVPFGEDIEWAYRVLCNGYSIVYEPAAAVIHSHERSPDYQMKRAAIDHYRLYQLFGVRTVPTRWRAMQGALRMTLRDAQFLAAHFELSPRWWKSVFNVPRFAWSSAWGQYWGAKTAAAGEPPPVSRDV